MIGREGLPFEFFFFLLHESTASCALRAMDKRQEGWRLFLCIVGFRLYLLFVPFLSAWFPIASRTRVIIYAFHVFFCFIIFLWLVI